MNSAEKKDNKAAEKAIGNNAIELKRPQLKSAQIPAACKDGVCTLNWKPRRPDTAA